MSRGLQRELGGAAWRVWGAWEGMGCLWGEPGGLWSVLGWYGVHWDDVEWEPWSYMSCWGFEGSGIAWHTEDWEPWERGRGWLGCSWGWQRGQLCCPEGLQG